MGLIQADVAAMTVAGVSTVQNRNMNGTQYTTRSGYTMSTNFSDNIRFGKKKKDKQKGTTVDSDSTISRNASTRASAASLRQVDGLYPSSSRRPSTLTTTSTAASTITTSTTNSTTSLKRAPTVSSVATDSSVMTRKSLKGLFKRKRKDSTLEKERDPITGSIIIRKSSIPADEPPVPRYLATEPSMLSLQQSSYFGAYSLERSMQESSYDDQSVPDDLLSTGPPPTISDATEGSGDQPDPSQVEQLPPQNEEEEMQGCRLNSEISTAPPTAVPSASLEERNSASTLAVSETDRRPIGAVPVTHATPENSAPLDNSDPCPTAAIVEQVEDPVPETHAVGIPYSNGQEEYESSYDDAVPMDAQSIVPDGYSYHYDYDADYIPSPPASVKDLVVAETKQKERKDSKAKERRERLNSARSETIETQTVEIGDQSERENTRAGGRKETRNARKHPSLMDLRGTSGGGSGTLNADLSTDAAHASKAQHRRRSLPNALLARPGGGDSSKAFNTTTGTSVTYLPPNKSISKSSSSFSISGFRMFQSKAHDSLSDGESPAIITNVSNGSLHSKSSKSTGKTSKETDNSTVSSDGTTGINATTLNTNNTNMGFGGFLKSFRKHKPEMITDANYHQHLSPLIDHSPELGDKSAAEGAYPVFSLPLVEAVKFNTAFETTDIFARSDEIDSQICAIEYQKYVPLIVLKCCKFLVRYGLEEQGLYRVSGSTSDVRRLQNRFINEGPAFEIDPAEEDIHTVSTLLKLYLRELPDDIFAIQRHAFLEYKAQLYPTADEEEIDPSLIPVQILQEELSNVPFCNFALLHVLIRHFKTVVEHANKNLMPLKNLALVFSPTLRIKKAVFIALVSRGDLLWKDLHPVTPRPRMDSTFANEYTTAAEARPSPFYVNAEFDFSQMPLPPPPAIDVERSPKSGSRPVSPTSTTMNGQFPIGIGLAIPDNLGGDVMYDRRFSNSAEKLSLTKTNSPSVSISTRSFSSGSVSTEPDGSYAGITHLAPHHPFDRSRLNSVDSTNGRTRGLPGYKAKSPRALFLGNTMRHHSYSAPGTPAPISPFSSR